MVYSLLYYQIVDIGGIVQCIVVENTVLRAIVVHGDVSPADINSK